MRALLSLIIVLSLGWAGYWFLASQGTRAGLSLWFEERRAEGWQANYSDLSIQGFPNRVDASFTDVALADPDTGLAWAASFFQLLALSYKPNHVIAVWPNTQTLSTPSETLSIASEKMQASVVVSPEAHLPLERSNYVATALSVRSDQGWSLQADDIRAALHKQPTGNNAYQLAYQAAGVAPPNFLSNGVLPAKMSAMEFDMEVDFDRAWDMRALSERRPQPTAIDLRLAKAEWGDLLFHMAADLDLDALGSPTGEATIRLKNWQKMIDLARASGQFGENSLAAAEQFIGILASTSGAREDLDVTLRFANGTTFLGIIPLGTAPRFTLR